VLRVARHGAVERHVPVNVHDADVRGVNQRVVPKLGFDGLANILCFSHFFTSPARLSGLAAQESPSWDSARVKATAALVILTGAIPPGGAEGSAGIIADQRSARRRAPHPKAVPIAVLLPGVGSPCRIGLPWGS